MTKKNKNNKSKKQNNKRQPTPFADTGGIVGTKVGSYFGGNKIFRDLGKVLGSGIGSIFGSGDYTMTGNKPGYNVLAGQMPKFSSTSATNVVSHREYLGDITGSAAFTNLAYPLNPGSSKTFPWLSTIAAGYQQYKFHGVVFEFRSLVTDFVTGGAPGVIVMTTNYDATSPTYISRQEAENAEFAVATKPTLNLMHMIECEGRQTQIPLHNVRVGPPQNDDDLRFSDYGTVQIITQNNPVQALGELWVSYCVEFFKPILPSSLGHVTSLWFHCYRGSVTNINGLGSIGILAEGNLAASTVVTGTTLTVSGLLPGHTYIIHQHFYSVNASTIAASNASALVGCTATAMFGSGVTPKFSSGAVGTGLASTSSYHSNAILASATTISVTYTAGVFAADTFMDMFLYSTDLT